MTRMSIDVPNEMHQKIKLAATLNNVSIKDYVVQAVQDKISNGFNKVPNSLTKKVLLDTDRDENLNKLFDLDELFASID